MFYKIINGSHGGRRSCNVGSTRDQTSCQRCHLGNFCAEGVMTQCKDHCDDGFELKVMAETVN